MARSNVIEPCVIRYPRSERDVISFVWNGVLRAFLASQRTVNAPLRSAENQSSPNLPVELSDLNALQLQVRTDRAGPPSRLLLTLVNLSGLPGRLFDHVMPHYPEAPRFEDGESLEVISDARPNLAYRTATGSCR